MQFKARNTFLGAVVSLRKESVKIKLGLWPRPEIRLRVRSCALLHSPVGKGLIQKWLSQLVTIIEEKPNSNDGYRRWKRKGVAEWAPPPEASIRCRSDVTAQWHRTKSTARCNQSRPDIRLRVWLLNSKQETVWLNGINDEGTCALYSRVVH